MDFNKIIKRVIGILTKPQDEWEIIKSEEPTIQGLFFQYAIFLAAIPAISGFFGFLFYRAPFGRALIWAIFNYILSLGGVYLFGFIMDALAPSFSSEKNLLRAVKIAVYSFTAFWVAGIFNLIPTIGVLGLLLSLYALYILYLGMKSLMDVPQDKLMSYFIISVVSAIIIFALIAFLVTSIVFRSPAVYFF